MKSVNGQKARIYYLTLIKQNLWYSQQINQKIEIDFEFHPDNATTLTRTISTKILGVHFQQINWHDHITELSKTCYAALSALRKMGRIAPFNIRKHLCESLALSKLDYCSSVFDPLTIIIMNHLEIQTLLTLLTFTMIVIKVTQSILLMTTEILIKILLKKRIE